MLEFIKLFFEGIFKNTPTNLFKGINLKPIYTPKIKKEFLLDYLKAPEYLIIHHSADNDRYTINDWYTIDVFHRSFRVNWDIFARPVMFPNGGEEHSGKFIKYFDSWYETSKVHEFMINARITKLEFTQKFVDGKYFQTPWRKVGYNLGIEKVNGKLTVQYGRTLKEQGCHCSQENMNNRSIGLCVLGNFDAKSPDTDLWKYLIDCCCEIKRVFPNIIIKGHREIVGVTKTCPGTCFDMDILRKAVG